MSTSDKNGVVRSAIHTSGGIKKTLLTPCRRIGLSRKRKAANTGFSSPLSQENVIVNYESPIDNIKAKSIESSITPLSRNKKRKDDLIKNKDKIIDTTPNNLLKSQNNLEVESSTCKDNKDQQVEPKSRSKKSKKKLILDSDSDEVTGDNNALNMSGCELFTKEKDKTEELKIATDKDDASSSRHKKSKKRNPLERKDKKRRKNLIIDSDSDNESIQINATNVHKPELENSEDKSLKDQENLQSYKLKSTSENSKQSIEKANSKESSITEKKLASSKINQGIISSSPSSIALSHLETKPLLLASNSPNHTECTNKTNDSNYKISSKSSELKIVVSRNSIDDYIKKKEKRKSKASTKLTSKLSTKKSSVTEEFDSDEEFLSKKPLNGDNHESEKSILIDKILQIENSVKDKEIQLEKFKQAEVYHKLHNVHDLAKLTETWKDGCKNALEDLLAKLREHANIDRQGLLQNLRAPKDLIKFDTENDCFL